MPRYIAIIDFAKGMFGAYFPDAPGCTAMGASEEEVIRNATDALSEWASDVRADGQKLPVPRSYVQLLKSGELEELGRGGMIATIPLISETGKTTRANVSMDVGLLNAIDEAASKRGLTRSAFLAAAAKEHLRDGG